MLLAERRKAFVLSRIYKTQKQKKTTFSTFFQTNDGRGERQRFNKQTDSQRSTSRSHFNKPLIEPILGQILTRSAAKWHREGAHVSHQ